MESKIDAQDIRNKQAEIEELTKIAAMKTQEVYFLREINSREHEKLKELQDEYVYRRELSHKIQNEIENFNDLASMEAFNNINEIRKKFIRNMIRNEFCSRVGQLDRLDKGIPNDPKDANFYQLVFESVTFIFNNRPLSFRIMKSTTFYDIKVHLCEIYKIEDHKDFIIADYLEALIINEDQSIDEYHKHYSVFLNVFNFIPREVYMKRQKLSLIQEDRLKENLISKNRNAGDQKKRKGQEVNQDYDVVQKKINDLNTQFPHLKIFHKDEKGAKLLPPKFTILEKAKNIETSFIMCIILVFLYCFTIVSIFNRPSMLYLYIKRNEMQSFYDNKNVQTYSDLHNYLTTRIGFTVLSKNDTLYSEEILKIQTGEDVKIYNYTYKDFKFTDYNYKDMIKVTPIKIITYQTDKINCNDNLIRNNSQIVCSDAYITKSTSQTIITTKKESPLFYLVPKANATYPHFYDDSIIGILESQGTVFEVPLSADYRLFSIDLLKAIPINPNFHTTTINSKFDHTIVKQDINEYAFVSSKIRSIQIFFTLFSKSENSYYSIRIGFYFLPTGIITPGSIKVNISRFDLFSGNLKNQISEAIRFICVFILFCLMVFNLVNIIISSQEGMFVTNFIKKMSQTTLWLIIVYMVIFFLKVTRLSNSNPLNDNLILISDSLLGYNDNLNVLYLECFYLLIISIKLLYFMNLNETVSLYFNSVFDYVFRSALYLFFCILTILIYSSILLILMGTVYIDNANYTLSYITVLTAPIGGFDWAAFGKYDVFWGIIFSVTFYSFLAFYMFAILISLFNESLRERISLEGYPTDNVQVDWTTYDYLRWLFFCLKSDESRSRDQN